MKLIIHWWGTDALTLVENPPTDTILWYFKLIAYRWKWKILHRLFDEHWVVYERLRQHLLDFGTLIYAGFAYGIELPIILFLVVISNNLCNVK